MCVVFVVFVLLVCTNFSTFNVTPWSYISIKKCKLSILGKCSPNLTLVLGIYYYEHIYTGNIRVVSGLGDMCV